ncbi:pilus assembly protein TadG-related protein, partial [Streptococcus pneumoniae]|uniref:pilus assembly protein TadG-related protein n=1 Tax=Streptococcus pneumoniae TaxID=1313 RepID=UPI001CB78D42
VRWPQRRSWTGTLTPFFALKTRVLQRALETARIPAYCGARHGRGAVAVTVAFVLLVLMAFLGVVVDLGAMYVTKSELQNAADSCALAAAQELDGNTDALLRAENAGITAGARNGAY